MGKKNSPSTAGNLLKSRNGLIIGGGLVLLFGIVAMTFPLLFSVIIAKSLGVFALVSGGISVALAIFEKHPGHRALDAFTGCVRIAAGIALFICVASSVMVITLIFAIFLVVEGIALTAFSFRLRENPGWVATLVNGVGAIVLGVLIYLGWPSDSTWVLGLFFGINLIFNGAALLTFGLCTRKLAAV